MRKQVGWYNPKSGGLCMKRDKTSGSGYEAYIVPVFADDTVPMFTDETPRVPEYKKPRDENSEDENSEDDRLMNAIQAQVLENQVAMLLIMLRSCDAEVKTIEIIRNLVSMRRSSMELLERLKKNEQARGN